MPLTSFRQTVAEDTRRPKVQIAGAGRAPLTARRTPNTGGIGYGSKSAPFVGGKPGTAGTAPLAHRRTPTTAKVAAHTSPAAIAAATAQGTKDAAATRKRVAAANAKAQPPAVKPKTTPRPASTGHSIVPGITGPAPHAAGAPNTSSPSAEAAGLQGGGIDLFRLLELGALAAGVILLIVYMRKRR